MTSSDLAVRDERRPNSLATRDELSIDDLVAQVGKIQQAMGAVMKQDEHFGVIPGTGTKPTLLKPGAEKLCLLFRLDPEYEYTEQFVGEHLHVTVKCTLYHIPTGNRVASGLGSCSTRESKYAYRNAKRKCPVCAAEAIIKGKAEYGGGWVCFKKQGGCGAKFQDGDDSIEGQKVGRVANPDLADQYNTVLKMAAKRSLIAATLNGTAASDLFTQDLEDLTAHAETLAEEMPHDSGPIEDAEIVRAPDGSVFPDQRPVEGFQAPAGPRGGGDRITDAQKKLVAVLKKKLVAAGQTEDGLDAEIQLAYGVESVADLSKREASDVIGGWKKRLGEE